MAERDVPELVSVSCPDCEWVSPVGWLPSSTEKVLRLHRERTGCGGSVKATKRTVTPKPEPKPKKVRWALRCACGLRKDYAERADATRKQSKHTLLDGCRQESTVEPDA